MFERARIVIVSLLLAVVCLPPALAERGGRQAAERNAARETRDRERQALKAERRERARREQRTRERSSGKGSLTERTTLSLPESTSGSQPAESLDTSRSGSSLDSSGSGSGSSGSGSSGSGSSGSGSDSSGPGSGDSSEVRDHSGPGSGDDDREAMATGRGTPIDIERDARGREQRVGELLVIGSAALGATVRANGYEVIEERRLAAFDETLVRVRIPAGVSAAALSDVLRALLPDAIVASNHIFRPSGTDPRTGTLPAGVTSATAANIGIVDTGAFGDALALDSVIERTGAFAGSPYTPREHGTIVCRIAATSGSRLSVADVFGVDANARLIASADAIASALNWLVGHGLPVINISVAGPYNPVLEHLVVRIVQGGTLIVAAAGNQGPAATPAYPAAFPGVVAVTAVDEHGVVYRRASRGDYVMFAARGVHVPIQGLGNAPLEVSGTSFAAPVVAAELARRRQDQPQASAASLIEALRRAAVDSGQRGRDPVYGWGIVAGGESR